MNTILDEQLKKRLLCAAHYPKSFPKLEPVGLDEIVTGGIYIYVPFESCLAEMQDEAFIKKNFSQFTIAQYIGDDTFHDLSADDALYRNCFEPNTPDNSVKFYQVPEARLVFANAAHQQNDTTTASRTVAPAVNGFCRVRLFRWRTSAGLVVVCCTDEISNTREPREKWSGFIEWLTPWLDVYPNGPITFPAEMKAAELTTPNTAPKELLFL